MPPIDPQRVQDQDDMTWADYKPIPGTNWADPSLRRGADAARRARRHRFRGSAVRDHAAEAVGSRSAIRRSIRCRAPTSRSSTPTSGASRVRSTTATRSTSTGWSSRAARSASRRSTSSDRTGCRASCFEYGLNEYNQAGGCPAGYTCDGRMERDVDALWRADAGADVVRSYRHRAAHLRRLRRDDRVAGIRRDEVREPRRHPRAMGQSRQDEAALGDDAVRAVDVVAGRRAAVGPVVGAAGRELRHDHARARALRVSASATTTTIRTSRRTAASASGRGT